MIDFKNKNHRLRIPLTIFFISIICFEFISPYFFDKEEGAFLYTELQQSHMGNGKYKRDGIMWMERKTEGPLTGLVYDYTESGKRIDFGMLYEGHQHGIWRFFHENGKPSMENVYVFGEFKETTKRWDIDGTLLKNNY